MVSFNLTGLDGRRAEIEVGRGLQSALADRLGPWRDSGVFLLHDPALEDLAAEIAGAIDARGVFAASGTESAKSLAEIERLARLLLGAGADRGSILVVLGGGALLDLGAFLAGLYFRGMACALLPTSMLAAVDAAVGGKSAVDLGGTKNVLGLFRQPDLVLCDPAWIDSLPDHEFRQGLAELIKMAAILDEEAFHHLEGVISDLKRRDQAAIDAAVEAGMRLKIGVVRDDERETGRRIFLNFGHTLGHALESLSGYRLPHGEAVALGMVGELEMLELDGSRLEALLASAGLPIAIPQSLRRLDELWAAMKRDKKNRRAEVRVAIPIRIGHGEIRGLKRHDLERLR